MNLSLFVRMKKRYTLLTLTPNMLVLLLQFSLNKVIMSFVLLTIMVLVMGCSYFFLYLGTSPLIVFVILNPLKNDHIKISKIFFLSTRGQNKDNIKIFTDLALALTQDTTKIVSVSYIRETSPYKVHILNFNGTK